MSFFGSKSQPTPQPKPMGLETDQLPSNEPGRRIPWFVGTAKMGSVFISEVYNIKAEPIQTEVGKERRTTGHNYFASYAVSFCHGPVDRITKIYFDDQEVWTGTINRGVEDYVDITITGRGVVRLYWGTETQSLDDQSGSTDDLAGTSQVHTPYKGRCYMVLRQPLWGAGHVNAPSISVVIGRFPEPSWMTPSAEIDSDCNPIAAIWDLWTNHRAGMGRPESGLDTTALDAAAVTLNSEGLGLSPVLTSPMSFREFVAKIGEYVDCYPYETDAGKFAIGLKRSTESSTISLVASDILDPPRFDPPSWESTYNEFYMNYTDRDRQYQKNQTPPYRDRSNFTKLGYVKISTLERPWITKSAVALKILTGTARHLAQPVVTGRVKIRQSALGSLREGQLLDITWTQQGLTSEVFRAAGLTFPSPADPEVEIDIEKDNSYLNDAAYIPTVDALPSIPTLSPQAPTYQEAIEVPFEIANREEFIAAFFVGRPDLIHDRIVPWTSVDASSYYRSILHDLAGFARRGTMVNDYPDTTDWQDESQSLEIVFDTPETALTLPASEIDNASPKWLLYVDGEWMRVFEEQLTAAKQWRMKAFRGVFGSDKKSHSSGTEAWLIEHQRLPLSQAGSYSQDRYWKLQPTILGEGVALSSLTAEMISPVGAAIRPPTPKNLRTDDLLDQYGTGEDVVLEVDDTTQNLDYHFWERFGNVDHQWADTARFYIFTIGDVEAGGPYDFALAANYTLTNAQIQAALGSETDFVVKCYLGRKGFYSANPDTLTITKV